MSSVTLPKEQKLRFNEQSYLVKKMTLGQYARFSEKLEELLPDKDNLEALINGGAVERVQVIMQLFKAAPVRFAELIEIATSIPLEKLMESTPEEVFDLAERVYELNEVDKIGERIKKVLSLGTTQA